MSLESIYELGRQVWHVLVALPVSPWPGGHLCRTARPKAGLTVSPRWKEPFFWRDQIKRAEQMLEYRSLGIIP